MLFSILSIKFELIFIKHKAVLQTEYQLDVKIANKKIKYALTECLL